jgi:hypothetical protein
MSTFVASKAQSYLGEWIMNNRLRKLLGRAGLGARVHISTLARRLTSCSRPTFDRAFFALPLCSVAVKRGSTERSVSRFRGALSILVAAIAVIFISSGCSTVRSTDLPLEQLQAQIVAGEIIQPGEFATIITSDGKRHSIKVSKITGDSLVGEKNVAVKDGIVEENAVEGNQTFEGKTIDIPIVDIVAIETKESTVIGTTARVAAGSLLDYLMIGVIFALLFPF